VSEVKLTIKVVEKYTLRPISGAMVRIDAEVGITDGGYATFTLPAKFYRISVAHKDYVTKTLTLSLTAPLTIRVELMPIFKPL